MRLAWLFLVLAACGRKNFDDAAIDDTGGTIDTPIDTGDDDTDGIINSSDNCPAHYNQTQADGDGDRVGDACDPHPLTAGDRLIAIGLFGSGFGAWVPDSPTNWTIGSGAAHTANPSTDNTQARLSVNGAAAQPTVQIGFTVEDYASVSDENVLIRIAGASDNWACVVTGQSSFLDDLVVYRGISNVTNTGVSSIGPSAPATLSISYEPGNITCQANGVVLAAGLVPMQNTNYIATVEVRGLAVAIQYAALYGVD